MDAVKAEEIDAVNVGSDQISDDDEGIQVDDDAEEHQIGEPAAEADADEQQQEVSAAEVERLQKLFAKLSPECNEEVKLAYTEGKEVSDECKQEVQMIMQQEATQQGKPKKPRSDLPDPTGTIVGFAVLLVAGLVAWGVYAQKNIISKMPESKPKKISKQKQQKLRMKEQRNAGIQ